MTPDLHEALIAEWEGGGYESKAAFSRAIQEAGHHMPGSTLKDWLRAEPGSRRYTERDGDRELLAWLGKGKPYEGPSDLEEEPEDPTGWQFEEGYTYNGDNDVYVFFLRCRPHEPYPLPGGKVRRMVRSYSNYDGEPATRNEIAREEALPKQEVIEILGALGVTHDHEPRTKEEMRDGDLDELVQDDLQHKRRKYHIQLQQEDWKATKKAAKRWERKDAEIQKMLDGFFEGLEEVGSFRDYSVPRVKQSSSKERRIYDGNHQDLHIGLRPAGSSVTLEQQKDSRFGGFKKLVSDAARCYYVDEFVLNVMPDAGHTDARGDTTTSGTRVEAIAGPGRIGATVYDLAVDMINYCRQYGRVHWVMDTGNHNNEIGQVVNHALSRHFAGCEDVVFVEPRGPICFVVVGDHLLVYFHGDVTKKRLRKIGNIIIDKARDLLARTSYITINTGHLHFQAVWDDAGLVRRQAPTPAEPDGYHDRNLFVGARKLMQANLLNPHGYDDHTMSVSFETPEARRELAMAA